MSLKLHLRIWNALNFIQENINKGKKGIQIEVTFNKN